MWWYRGLRALVVQELTRTVRSAGPVLDAGCSTGGMLAQLGPDALGLEHDETAASLARDKAERPVACGSVNEMPFGGGVLAAYVSLDVLCHGAVEPQASLKEARRCLQPGGVAVFNLPAYGWMLSAHDRRVHNVRRFTRGQARQLLEGYGFRIERARYWNWGLFPLMVLHRLTRRADAASDVHDFPAWLDALFQGVLTIERLMIRIGFSLPYGGSILIVARRHD